MFFFSFQLLGGNVSQTSSTLLTSQHNAPSPLSGTNENSLSPSGGSSSSSSSSISSSGGGTANGPLSPGAMSQTSTHNAGSAAPITTTAANTLSNCPEGPIASASMLAAAAAAAAAAGSSSNHTSAGSGGSCCENGRPIMTDPVSGQTVCSCQYDSARLALSNYSRMPSGSVGVYGTAYPSTEQNPYPSISVDSSAFYTPLVSLRTHLQNKYLKQRQYAFSICTYVCKRPYAFMHYKCLVTVKLLIGLVSLKTTAYLRACT